MHINLICKYKKTIVDYEINKLIHVNNVYFESETYFNLRQNDFYDHLKIIKEENRRNG